MTTATLDELASIPMSPALAATLARAVDFARAAESQHVLPEHMMFALTDDPDAKIVLTASQIDIELIREEMFGWVTQIPPYQGDGGPQALSVSTELKRILEAAAAAALGGRRSEIDGAIVLAAIVGDERTFAADRLKVQGLTFEEAIRILQGVLLKSARSAPKAEDVLASARERVQSRAMPGFDSSRAIAPPSPPLPNPAGNSQASAVPANASVADAGHVAPSELQPAYANGAYPVPPAAPPLPPQTRTTAPALPPASAPIPQAPRAVIAVPPPLPPPVAPAPAMPPLHASPQLMPVQQQPAMGLGLQPAPTPAVSPPPSAKIKAKQTRSDAVPQKRGPKTLDLTLFLDPIARTMRRGIAQPVEIRLPKAEIDAIIENLSAAGKVWPGQQQAVVRALTVRLRSQIGSFYIETLTPDTQWIESRLGLMSDDYASWRWLVTPRKKGKQSIDAIVSSRTVDADGGVVETGILDQKVEIKVRANIAAGIKALTIFLIAVAIGGAAVWFSGPLLETSRTVLARISGG